MYPKNSPSGASLALALVAILSAPRPAAAADATVLRPVLEVEQGYDSNFRNLSNSNEGSLVTSLSPGLWIENSGELGFARLGVTAIGRSIWQDSNISGVDENGRGEFERRVTPRLTLFGDGLYDYYSGYEAIPGDVNAGGQPSWRNDHLGGGFRYLLTPYLALRLSGSAGRVNYERQDVTLSTTGTYRDRGLLSGRAVLQYKLTATDELNLSVDNDNTSYQNLGFGANDSGIWRSELSWTRSWSPVWSTSAAIGVSQTDSTQKDVPQAGGYPDDCFNEQGERIYCTMPLPSESFSASGTGLIGSLSIARSFARSALRLSYNRDTRSTGGSGRTNFDIDSFTLSATHRLAERVKLTVSGNYSLYHSVTSELPSGPTAFAPSPFPGYFVPLCGSGGTAVPVDSTYPFQLYQCVGGSQKETRQYTSLLARLDWRMRRRLNAYVITRYYHALTDQTFGGGPELETENLDKFTLAIGCRYTWDLDL